MTQNEKESQEEIKQAFMMFKNGGLEDNDFNADDVITFESLKKVAELIGSGALTQRKTFRTRSSER